MKKSNIAAIAILITAIGFGRVFAADAPTAPTPPEKPAKPAEPSKDSDPFWAQQKAEAQAHHQKQMEENKAFKATL